MRLGGVPVVEMSPASQIPVASLAFSWDVIERLSMEIKTALNSQQVDV